VREDELTRASPLIRWESWDQFWHSDAQALAQAEYEEAREALGLWKAHAPNAELLAAAQAQGILWIAVARVQGLAVGYGFMTIEPDAESEGHLIARQGPLYVSPEVRDLRLGARLIAMMISKARALGASELEFHHPVAGRALSVGRFVRSLGARPINQTYLLRLVESVHA
jgi:GNAT superfamily N-acetyltransferase